MVGFAEWLFQEERSLIDPAVVQGYDRAFQSGLEGLIQRTRDPVLKATFQKMRECPVRTANGCTSFANYLVGALIRHGIHRNCDPDEALNYLAFRLLSPVGEGGGRKGTVFDFDEGRPYMVGDNPLEARFKSFVAHDIRTLAGNRLRSLRRLDRPKGTVSIIPGRGRDEGIAAHEIPGRDTPDDELLSDIEALLARRSTPDFPVVSMFRSIVDGMGTREQRRLYGRSKSDLMRRTIVRTIEQYAARTENWRLMRLLDRIRDPEPPKPKAKMPKPTMTPDEQDFRSIVDVLERHGRRVGTAILGRARRRWLERRPRDPNSLHKNRLADTLAKMVSSGVLERRGTQFVPGSRYSAFLPQPVLQNQ